MKPATAAKLPCLEAELASKATHFAQMLQTIELLHRRFLDVITAELGRGDKTLSAVQALILRHAGERRLSLGELLALGHYEGTNIAYNITKLSEGGYITLSRPQWDKRSSRIELTVKGAEVADVVASTIDSHASSLAEIGVSEADLALITCALTTLSKMWS